MTEIAHFSPEKVERRLDELAQEIHDAENLRDHCQEWADEHHRTVLSLEHQRATLQERLAAEEDAL